MKTAKNHLLLLGLIFSVLLFSGCLNKKSESQPLVSEPNDSFSLSGSYRSVQGVMDGLSCYCFNAGYLTLENGRSVAVCFEDEELNVSCDKVAVEGKYKTEKINFEETSPCPDGEMTYFNAVSYKCN